MVKVDAGQFVFFFIQTPGKGQRGYAGIVLRCQLVQPLQGLQLAAPDKFHGSSLPF